MSKIKYYLYGDNQHILMFSYPLYLEQLNEFYEKVDDPINADVVFISYSQDIAFKKFPEFFSISEKNKCKNNFIVRRTNVGFKLEWKYL